jgi:hypothetical protein
MLEFEIPTLTANNLYRLLQILGYSACHILFFLLSTFVHVSIYVKRDRFAGAICQDCDDFENCMRRAGRMSLQRPPRPAHGVRRL